MLHVSIHNREIISAQQEMSFIRNFKYWVPVLLWMSFIFWMSTGTFSAQNTSLIIEPILHFLMPSISQEKMAMIHGVIRKFGHVTEYFILGILLFRAFRGGSKELRNLRWAFSSLLVVVLYAASDEFHQSFVIARTASLFDVAIDTLGGILAQGVSVLWHLNRL
jgi:VanZ family protein